MAAYRRTRIVKDFLESIREAGVALIEDRGMPRRDLEAAVSRALTDFLQVHSLIDGPAASLAAFQKRPQTSAMRNSVPSRRRESVLADPLLLAC